MIESKKLRFGRTMSSLNWIWQNWSHKINSKNKDDNFLLRCPCHLHLTTNIQLFMINYGCSLKSNYGIINYNYYVR